MEDDHQLVVGSEGETLALFVRLLGGRKRETRLTGEKRLPVHEGRRVFLHHAEKLREDAADRPDVDSRAVVFLKQDDLRGSVPPSNDVTRKFPLHLSSELSRLDESAAHIFFLLFCLVFRGGNFFVTAVAHLRILILSILTFDCLFSGLLLFFVPLALQLGEDN